MAYVEYDYYCSLYGDDIEKGTFDRLLWDATKSIDNATTGVDGVRKLKEFPPMAGSDDDEAVKHCMCSLIESLNKCRNAEINMQQTATSSGVHGGVISSVSAGNESISYATGVQTQIEKAVSDPIEKHKLINNIIRENLSGARDGNGVSLLYMGPYPAGRWPDCTETL